MRVLATCMLASLGACGPRLEQLVAQRHYREAVCAAHDGSSDDREYLHRSLSKDLDPSLHVEVVTRHQMRHALEGAGNVEQIAERARFIRVRLETNVVPLDTVDADIQVTAEHQLAGASIAWNTLAAITGEQLPPPVTYSTYAHGGTVLRVLAALLTLPATLPIGVAIGKRPPFTTFHERSFTREAPLEAYERIAPIAARLRGAMEDGRGCSPAPTTTRGRGVSCTWYVALDPTTTQPLTLELALAYEASHPDRDACRVVALTAIPLGTLHDLEARATRTFGSRLRPVRELTFR